MRDARVARRAGLLLVGRQQRVLEGMQELVLGDALLARQSCARRRRSLATWLSPPGGSNGGCRRRRCDTTPVSAATVTSSSVAPSSSPVKERRPSWSPRVRTSRAAADVAAEVLGLGQRPLGPGRGDLERVLLAHGGEVPGDALAQVERDAGGVVDEEPDELAAHDLGEQNLDVGLRLCKAGLDVGLDRAHVHPSPFMKKAGERPLSEHTSALRPNRKLCVQISTAERLEQAFRRPLATRSR